MKEQHGFAQEQPGTEPTSASSRSSGEQPKIAPGKKMDQNQQNQPGQAGYTERVQQVSARSASASPENVSNQGSEKVPAARSNPGNANNSNNAGTVENTGRYDATPSPLQRFGNYDLVHRIDMGGMGEVYLARQRTAFGREVAVKIIRSDLMHDITVRKRFLREAEVNAYLKHDHILSLVEFGEEKGRLFLVTPYIKGGTLSKRLRNGSLTLSETHELFTALVQAVSYLHKRGVIHRDLKPSNILLDQEEGSERVYVRLIDFGIASLQGLTASAPLTTAGHEMGTAAYMAPERLGGVAAPSNDIYSLGIILYQMLTGKLPANEIDAMLPDPLADVVQHSTAPDPGKRYATADELLNEFERAYQSLSLSHFRVPGSNPDFPQVGRNIAANVPLARPKAQPPSSNPITPMPNDRPSRPPVTPAANSQAGIPANTPGVSPVANRFNAANTLNSSKSSNMSSVENNITPSRKNPPASNTNEDLAQIKTTRLQDEERVSRPSRPSNPGYSRPEVILPSLVNKGPSFSGADYEAPTSYVDPQHLQKSGTSIASEHTTRVGQGEKVVPRLQKKKRGSPIVTIITVISIIIFFVIGSILYGLYQSLDTATITIMPHLQTISTTFSLTAKLNQTSVDVNAGIIPAGVLSSTKSASQQGNTTGQSDCSLFFIDCKQSVSLSDVDNLDAQIRPGVKTQIQQDIHQQEQTQNVTPIGNIVYTNEVPTASPAVGTVSKTVTVTLSLEGSQEYIKSADAHTVASQKLQGQLKPGYALIDTTLQIGQPVVQSIDTQGNAQIKIAAAGVSRYQISQSEISNMQNHIVGKSQKDARAFIAQNPNLDPQNISIRLSYGDTLPGNTQQIKINEINPPTMPTVQLPTIPNP
jgi:serine/threonine protein kinase